MKNNMRRILPRLILFSCTTFVFGMEQQPSHTADIASHITSTQTAPSAIPTPPTNVGDQKQHASTSRDEYLIEKRKRKRAVARSRSFDDPYLGALALTACSELESRLVAAHSSTEQ